MNPEEIEKHPFGIREKLVLGVLAAGIAVIVWGTKMKGWYFEDLSGVFLIMGIISSLIMGWGPNIIAKGGPQLCRHCRSLYDDWICQRNSGGAAEWTHH